MESYYRLNCLTRKKHGLPPQPLSFFRKVKEHLIDRKLGCIVEASYGGNTVASAICLHFGENAIMKYAAYDETYQLVRPNNLLMWEAIQSYSRAGYKRLSFGRTDMRHVGLRHFKNGWDTSERILRYYKFDLKLNQPVPDSHQFIESSTHVLKRIPIPALRVFGRLLYKHIG
jgi:lipid II:glycine glycyltransferase (peptidoglycan interpeptide bridge formation enzyme)